MPSPSRNRKRPATRKRARRGRASKAPSNRRRVRKSLAGKGKKGAAKKKRRGGPSPWRKRLGAVALILVGLCSGVFITAAAGFFWFKDHKAPGGGGPVAVSWPDGLAADETAELLGDLGLTDNVSAMAIFLRATGGHECAQPGPHLLPSGVTPPELLAALCRQGDRPQAKVTFPEGFHRFAIAKRLAKKGVVSEEAFLHASADREALYRLGVEPSTHPKADSAEGFLFPATYPFPIDSRPADVVARLVTEGQRRFDRAAKKHPKGWARLQELGLDRRGALTLASMVEKEAAVAEERATIASVFLNRLGRDDYPHLQSDPTAVYGCYAMPELIPACQGFTGRATPAINRDRANVFSTYVTPGLPPGPVCNPGDASMEAVLAPADTAYLFFVAKGGGRHTFTEDYEAHQQAVEKLRAMRP